MHVLLEVGAVSIGGPQSWICDIAPALKQRGAKVSVMSFGAAMPRENIMRERLHEAGITTHEIVLRGNKWEKWRKAEIGMRSVGKCDVAHFNSDKYSGWLVPFAKRLHIPVRIMHSRTPYWGCRSRRFGDIMLHWWFGWQARHYCTHAFGVTREALTAMVGTRGTRKIPCEVVPSAIRSDRFSNLIAQHALVRREAGAKDLVIGFVGRMVATKNPRYLVEILAVLRHQRVNASLVFMGTGPEEDAVRNMATQLGVGRHVTLLPLGENVGAILAERMDVLVLPSEYEGTPRVVVEAQACGLSVICSTAVSNDVCIVPELFHRMDVLAGPKLWAEKALQICATRVSREHVKNCFAGSPFEIENQADWLLEYYQRCLRNDVSLA